MTRSWLSLPKQEMDLLLYGEEQKFEYDGMNRTYRGVITNFTRAYIERDLKTRSEKTQAKNHAISHRRSLPGLQRCAPQQGRAELQDQRP